MHCEVRFDLYHHPIEHVYDERTFIIYSNKYPRSCYMLYVNVCGIFYTPSAGGQDGNCHYH